MLPQAYCSKAVKSRALLAQESFLATILDAFASQLEAGIKHFMGLKQFFFHCCVIEFHFFLFFCLLVECLWIIICDARETRNLWVKFFPSSMQQQKKQNNKKKIERNFIIVGKRALSASKKGKGRWDENSICTIRLFSSSICCISFRIEIYCHCPWHRSPVSPHVARANFSENEENFSPPRGMHYSGHETRIEALERVDDAVLSNKRMLHMSLVMLI